MVGRGDAQVAPENIRKTTTRWPLELLTQCGARYSKVSATVRACEEGGANCAAPNAQASCIPSCWDACVDAFVHSHGARCQRGFWVMVGFNLFGASLHNGWSVVFVPLGGAFYCHTIH